MARQYQKSCRDCGNTIYMLEQANGQWRAYDDPAHDRAHQCKKNQTSQSQSSGQAGSTQTPLGSSAPAKSASPGSPQEPGFTALQEQVIRRIVADEIKKRLGGLVD